MATPLRCPGSFTLLVRPTCVPSAMLGVETISCHKSLAQWSLLLGLGTNARGIRVRGTARFVLFSRAVSPIETHIFANARRVAVSRVSSEGVRVMPGLRRVATRLRSKSLIQL